MSFSELLEGMFINPTRGELSLQEALREIEAYMQERPQCSYELVVGCDSSAVQDPTFPLVVVVLRKGGGGRFFLKRIRYPGRRFYNIHQRILEEVLLSCQFALHLKEVLVRPFEKRRPEIAIEFKYIHADVGHNGPTRDMIKEVAGLIRGNGFEPRIKPESFVASSVADRYS